MIYLDNAATSFPKPPQVVKKVEQVLRHNGANPGRGSHTMAIDAARVVFSAREAASRLINAPDSSRIVFTRCATEGINLALKGILKPGDRVVTTAIEHNAVSKTLSRLERESGIYVTRLKPSPEGLIDSEDIGHAVRKETRVVVLSHASNVFGTVQDLRKISREAKAKGALLMVDSAQTLGAMPVDVKEMKIDILAATGHKALLGPQGTGFVYFGEGVEPLPLNDGGTGDSDTALELPERLEAGTLNTPGLGGLGAGIEFILKEGVSKIRAYEQGLVNELLAGLKALKRVRIIGPRGARRRASLVSFNLEGVDPARVGRLLDEEDGIMVRCGVHCAPDAHREAGTLPEGAVRVSPGYFSKPMEIEAFLSAVGRIARGA